METYKSFFIDLLFWFCYSFSGAFIVFGGDGFTNLIASLWYIPIEFVTFYTIRFIIFPLHTKDNFLKGYILIIILLLLAGYIHSQIIILTFKKDVFVINHLAITHKTAYIIGYSLHILLIFSSFAICHYLENLRNREKLSLLMKQKLETEIRVLNNQLQPHFLLNTLNNLYVLALEKSKKTPATIIKLADLLRYFTYENTSINTYLFREIEAVGNYLDILQLKHQEDLNVSLSILNKSEHILIPCNIIFPLIENAFKHSNLGYDTNAFVSITILEDLENNSVNVKIENSIAKKYNNIEYKGVGLANIEKKLSLLFNSSDMLQIKSNNNVFVVQINLPITFNNA